MPKVSVITPNYHHARYLPRRLESILSQSFRDFELIILDDASPDNSREVIQRYAGDPRVRTMFNDRNSGGTFKQWNLGLSQASGEYVWFAESDDFADPSLLGTLVERLDRNPHVGLAFCQSWVVDEGDKVLGNYRDFQAEEYRWTWSHEGLDPEHWREDYLNSGRTECLVYLYQANTIPNASAVLFRREVLERVGGAPTGMVICGDWLTYVRVLLESDIAFVSTPLNYFRRHPETVRNKASKGSISLREARLIRKFLCEQLEDRELEKSLSHSLPGHVGWAIGLARRPPRNKVPAREALNLLTWFARFDRQAFRIALPMLAKEQAADLSRRMGLLGVARRVREWIPRRGARPER